jgi:hypothetical protein
MLAPYEPRRCRAVAAKVVIHPEPEPERLISRPDNMQADSFRIGRILSIGTDAAKALPELAEGDYVLYVQSTACTTAMRDRAIVHHDAVICGVDGPGELNAKSLSLPPKVIAG